MYTEASISLSGRESHSSTYSPRVAALSPAAGPEQAAQERPTKNRRLLLGTETAERLGLSGHRNTPAGLDSDPRPSRARGLA